jgi:hypothetical protein
LRLWLRSRLGYLVLVNRLRPVPDAGAGWADGGIAGAGVLTLGFAGGGKKFRLSDTLDEGSDWHGFILFVG